MISRAVAHDTIRARFRGEQTPATDADLWEFLAMVSGGICIGTDQILGGSEVMIRVRATAELGGRQIAWEARAAGLWNCPGPNAQLRAGLADLLAGTASPETLAATFDALWHRGYFRDGDVEWSAVKQDGEVGDGRIIKQTREFIL